MAHHGDWLARGHYTCWVRAGALWVHYDDSVVGRPVSTLPPSVATDAYLVFYELLPAAPAVAPEPAHQRVQNAAAVGPESTDGAEERGTKTSDGPMDGAEEVSWCEDPCGPAAPGAGGYPGAGGPSVRDDGDEIGGDVEMVRDEESDDAMDTT